LSQHRPTTPSPLIVLALVAALAAIAGLSLSARPSHAQTAPAGDPSYGINFVNYHEPWLPLAVESGAGVVRWQFNWRDYELSPGVWAWETSDKPIYLWNSAGLRVHAILHYPPYFWAANQPGGLMPGNLGLPWNDSENGWGRFCNRFAQRYQGQIASYEVWNEPDVSHFWDGTPEQYYELLKDCYQGIKAADPAVPVSMAGVMVADSGLFPQVLRAAAADPEGAAHNHFFDVVSIHAYNDPERVYELAGQAHGALEQHGLGDKPIWLTEFGIPVRGYGTMPDSPDYNRATEEEAAWYLLQAISNGHAAGVERMMVYRLADDYADEAFGLMRIDHSQRPAYRAYQLAVGLMRDIESASHTVGEDGVVVNEMRRADGVRVVAVYSLQGTAHEVSLPAEKGLGVLYNAAGETRPLQADAEGQYTFSLPEAAGRDFSQPWLYSVGGPVLILVE
jgi:hypothetical protein